MKSTKETCMEMSPCDYLINRLDDQIIWFDKKSSYNQKWYKRLKKAETACTLSLPVIGIIPFPDYTYNKFLLVAIGAITSYIRCCSNIETYYELWTRYRTASEFLKKEKSLYQTSAGIYSTTEDKFFTLVDRVESILSAENSQWNSIIQSIPSNLKQDQSSTAS